MAPTTTTTTTGTTTEGGSPPNTTNEKYEHEKDENQDNSATYNNPKNKHQSTIQVSTERIINAPIEVVWEIMVDVNKYSDWNPFIVSVDCHNNGENYGDGPTKTTVMKVGTIMTLNVVFPNKHHEQSQQSSSSGQTTNTKKQRPKIVQSKEEVLVLDPPNLNDGGGSSATTKSATWSYRFISWLDYFNLVRATRIQHLTEIVEVSPSKDEEDGMEQQRQRTTTRYYTEELFSGWLARFVPLNQVQVGFEVQAQALKDHAEWKETEQMKKKYRNNNR